MAEVIILNGPPGVGKSTVAAELRALVSGTVVIGGDELRAFAPADARAHLGGGATYRAAGALASAFLEMGAARIVFEYVFLRASHFEYFRAALRPPMATQTFTLWAPLEIVTAREIKRPDRQRLGPAVRECYHEMAQNIGIMGQIVVNDDAGHAKLSALRIHELARSAAPGAGVAQP